MTQTKTQSTSSSHPSENPSHQAANQPSGKHPDTKGQSHQASSTNPSQDKLNQNQNKASHSPENEKGGTHTGSQKQGGVHSSSSQREETGMGKQSAQKSSNPQEINLDEESEARGNQGKAPYQAQEPTAGKSTKHQQGQQGESHKADSSAGRV